ncbi:MAG: hypothetical protein ACP6IS_11165 [Candidatus Asgardarchaeia archaeon]
MGRTVRMWCDKCKREVNAVVCGKRKASSRYYNVHYCCPIYGQFLNTRLEPA